MKRTQQRVIGFDCRSGDCPACARGHRGDHGISGGRYHWIVTADEGDAAVSACIYAADYPATVDPSIRREHIERQKSDIAERMFGPLGSYVVHAAYPTSREQVLTGSPSACDYIGQCYAGGDSSDVRFPFAYDAERGGILYDQPEEFWKALEERAAKDIARCRAARADREWMVCPECNGEQTVRRKP